VTSRRIHSTIFIVLLASVGTSLGRLAFFSERPCDANARTVLLDAVPEDSATLPRWVGCFGVAEARPGVALRSPLQTTGALARFERAAETGARQARTDFGVALALAGDAGRGINTLEGVIAEREEAATLSNLSAAHLLRASRTRSAYSAILALEYAVSASRLDADNPAARYNEALALTLLELDEQANAAWRGYLRLDSTSRWSRQARAYLDDPRRGSAGVTATLERLLDTEAPPAEALTSICARARQTCREHVEEVILPEWARATLAKDQATADSRLHRARALVAALGDRADRLDRDLLEHIDRLRRSNDPRLLAEAAGCDAYGRARAAFEREQASGALFSEAEQQLERSGSPLWEWARAHRVYAAFNTYDAARLQSLGPVLSDWASGAERRGYAAVAGRLNYLAALSFANRAQFVAAEPLFSRSLDALEHAADRDHLASTQWAIGNARFRLGDREEGWQWFGRAFETLRSTDSSRRRYVILLNAGLWLANQGLHHAASLVFTAARDEGIRGNEPGRVAESLMYRARAYVKTGDFAAARADVESGTPDGSRNGGWGQSERSRNEYLSVAAELALRDDPDASITAASEALAFFKGRGFAARVAELQLLRGRAYKAMGDVASAAIDFEAGIDTYERYRRGLTSEQQRLTSQDVVWELYEEHLSLAAATDPEHGLDAAERGRARTLHEALSDGPESPSPRALEGTLHAHERVIYYAFVDRALLAWVIGPGSTTFVTVHTNRPALERLVRVFIDSVAHGAPRQDWQPLAELLFSALIGPVRHALPSHASVIVVPDGVLNLVPFAALRDRSRQQFLIEQYELTFAPSAAVLLKLRQTGPPAAPPARVLVAGGPLADDATLTPLAGAAAEGARIAALYPDPELLAKERATKAAFVARLPSADVVHFAGHAVASPDYPLLAHLEFSADGDVPGSTELGAAEISRLTLDRTRVVVLAACDTGVGALRRGEGVLSLARPFLAAGASSVAATLWPIDDQGATPLLVALHRHLVRGARPGHALRQAQLEFMDSLPVSVWAAFSIIGNASDGRTKER
jgi:CHAT domain-containing protein